MRSLLSIFQISVGLSLLILGCSPSNSAGSVQSNAVLSVFSFDTTKINEIQKEKTNSTVRLQGRIVAQAPLLGQRAFELQDATGTVWVVTKEKLPVSGSEVKMTGKVRYQRILLDGKEQGTVYVEHQGTLEVTPEKKASSAFSS